MADNLSNYSIRNGETTTRQFVRSGRFFQMKGHWFFKTREGIDYGPYVSRTECRYAYNEFLDLVASQNELGSIPIDFEDSGTQWKVPKISFN